MNNANLKIRWARLENGKIQGLQSNLTLQSNRGGDLVITRDARLGYCKLIFRFSKIFAL